MSVGPTRTALGLAPALLAFASLSALCPREPARRDPPVAVPDIALAPLSAELSEPAGYFDTDNLISNESSYLQVADQLAEAAPGGVYVGVGPEQNFSYIARLRPRYAFILDVRRGNLLQHLFFATLFARADDPRAYLCLLFSRPCADAGSRAPWPGADRALDALPPPSQGAFESNLQAAYRHIEGTLGFALAAPDRAHIEKIARAFFDEQGEIRFRSFGRPRGAYQPTYRMLLQARSPSGRFGSFLESEVDYAYVRDLSRRNGIVPVVGSFAGTHALRGIGAWMRARGLTVSAFYTSNVEFYLLRDQIYDRFAANLRALPSRPDSLLIRACFDYGRPHPATVPGNRSVTVLQHLPRFLELHAAHAYADEWDVCTVDYLD
jgi:hypothetical protein